MVLVRRNSGMTIDGPVPGAQDTRVLRLMGDITPEEVTLRRVGADLRLEAGSAHYGTLNFLAFISNFFGSAQTLEHYRIEFNRRPVRCGASNRWWP